MSTEVQNELDRLNRIKERIRTNLVAQGITVPEDTMLEAMAEQILSVAGYTPQKGVDYWTEADQEAIIQQVITALGTPVFGRVDADNNIILTGELADGTYTIKYEDADGNVTEIGTYEQDADAPTYTNLLNNYPIDRDKRVSSSAGAPFRKDALGAITVIIPFADVMEKTLRIKAPYIEDTTADGVATTFGSVSAENEFKGYVFNQSNGNLDRAPCAVNEGNNTYSFLINDENVVCPYVATSFMHITIVVNTTGTAVTDDELAQVVITIDEQIV